MRRRKASGLEHALKNAVGAISGFSVIRRLISVIAHFAEKNSWLRLNLAGDFAVAHAAAGHSREESRCPPKSRLASSAEIGFFSEHARGAFVDDLAVSDFSMLPGEHRVFNLEVEGAHEFVANGILVHNCAFPQSGDDDQVDAAAGAFNKLLSLKTFVATQEMVDEVNRAGALRRRGFG
jgi:hypothetical protein